PEEQPIVPDEGEVNRPPEARGESDAEPTGPSRGVGAPPIPEARLEALASADPDDPIELAPGVFWVGHYLPGDPFQCHVYLIVHGDQSVLIDPGSRLTFPWSLPKIERVTAFSNIRYFICHH